MLTLDLLGDLTAWALRFVCKTYTGATASGTQCITVLQTAIPGGMWRLTGGYDDHQQFITIN